MKINYAQWCALGLCALLSSCSATYKYVQICTAEPVTNATTAQKTENGLVYENEDCKVFYRLWGEGGDAGFVFYNKTDQVIHIDLTQTFFVKNGVAYDYYFPTTTTSTTTTSSSSATSATYGGTYYALSGASIGAGIGASASATAGGYGAALYAGKSASLYATTGAGIYGSRTQMTGTIYGHSESVSTESRAILSIPPKTYRGVSLYSIREELVYDCDLNTYPEQSAHITYSADNSPLLFANYISYRVGDNGNTQAIDNQFYISDITNYAVPYITTFVRRTETCSNVLTPEEQERQKYAPELFDAYLKVDGTNTFFIRYSAESKHKLYKTDDGYNKYVWDSYNKGFRKYLTNGNSYEPQQKNSAHYKGGKIVR